MNIGSSPPQAHASGFWIVNPKCPLRFITSHGTMRRRSLSQARDVSLASSCTLSAIDLCLDPVKPCILGIISAVSVAPCCRFLPPVWCIFGLFAFTPSTLHLPSHPQVLCIFVRVRFHISGTAFPICFDSVARLGLFALTSVAQPMMRPRHAH